MKKKVTFTKIIEINGKKSGKAVSFDMDVEKLSKLQSEDAVKRKLKEYATSLKIMSKADIESAKCNCKEFMEAWREIKKAKDDELATLDPNRVTPGTISVLRPNEIFVFGSNLQGQHGAGAARAAYDHFGAIWGKGVGLQGQSYGIPTMHGGPDAIKPYVDEFIEFAKQHTEYMFLVTPIACGIAGFKVKDVAPLFAAAKDVNNIALPLSFWYELQ